MMSLVPLFDGQRPYQQIPVQYSIHILREPGGELEHKEFLHTENSDPSRPLAEQLISDLGKAGSIIVWNQAFEKTRNRELGELHPELALKMQAINDRVVDLMIPFKNKWYSDPRFENSASIKKVLPVLCPELSYQELEINKGDQAQNVWMQTVLYDQNPDTREQIFADLRKYCALDTYGIVAIWQKLTQSNS